MKTQPHMAQRDTANQKVPNQHCIHGDYYRSITACFIYYFATQFSKYSALYRMSPGSYQVEGFFFHFQEILQSCCFSLALKSIFVKLILNHSSPKQILFKRFNSAALKSTQTDNTNLFVSIRNAAFSESSYPIIFAASQPGSYKLNLSHLQK